MIYNRPGMAARFAAFCLLALGALASATFAQHAMPPTRANALFDMTTWDPIVANESCPGYDAAGCTTTYGFDWLSDGRMVLLTNDYLGHDQKPANRPRAKVSIISTPIGPTSTVTTIASHFKQPGGIKVVNDKIWVGDMDTVYVIPNNNPAAADTSTNRSPRFGAPLSSMHGGDQAPYNFKFNKANCSGISGCTSSNSQAHHYIFTPVYYQGKFYAAYGGATGNSNGRSDLNASSFYASAVLTWDSATTQLDTNKNRFAGGLRSPDGTTLGPNGSIFVTDHQGSWLPMCTLTRYKVGASKMQFGGYRQENGYTPNFGQAWYDRGEADYVPPVAINRYNQTNKTGWVGIAQPLWLDKGVYAGQILVGDINSRGLWRVALDTLNDTTGTENVQGAVFYFNPGSQSGNLGTGEAGFNRLTQGPDGTIYAGSGRKVGNWSNGKSDHLIYVFKPKASATQFEIMTIRSLKDGYELILSKKVDPATVHKSKFSVGQRNWVRQAGYGEGFMPLNVSGNGSPTNATSSTPKFIDRPIDSVMVSLDSMRIRLKVSGIKRINQERRGDTVTHWHTLFLFDSTLASKDGDKIYTTEADYAQNWINTAREWNGGSVAIDTTPVPIDTVPEDTVVSINRGRIGTLSNNVWFGRSPGVIRVNVDNMTQPYQVMLRDISGRVLFHSGKLAAGVRATEIKAPGKSQAVYTIEVRSGGDAYTRIVTF